MSTSVYDFTLAAAVGATQRISVQGNQALVRSASGGTVELITDKGRRYVCDEGQGFQLPDDETFRELLLINRQAVANTGFLFVGDSTYIDRRITGNVRIIDQSADKTAAGAQFLGSIGKTPTVGTNFAVSALLAGAKTVYVKRLAVAASAAGQVSLGLGSAAPATLPVALGNFANKLQTGGVSTSSRATGEAVGFFPTTAEVPGATVLVFALVQANAFQEIPLTTPIALPPGKCLFAVGPAVNTTINMICDFEES